MTRWKLMVGVGAVVALCASVGTAVAEEADTASDPAPDAAVISDLRDAGIGWGDIVKITTYADALGMTAEEYLVMVPVVDGDFDFGDVDGELRAQLLGNARNFGELVHAVKAAHAALAEDDGDDEEETTVVEDGAESEGECTEPCEDDEGEDADGEDEAADEELKAQLLAEAFGVEVGVIQTLRESAGWGVVFKLMAWSQAMGVEDPTSMIPEDGTGWSLGKLKKSLTDEQRMALGDAPRNLGHVMSGRWAAATGDESATMGNGKGHGKNKAKKPKKNG